jgi:hypothetical protein
MPVFSLPCPTVIFTFGVLCLAGRSVPLTLLLIPTLWAVIGTSAALTLEVPEDFGLPIAAVITVMVLVAQRRSHAVQATA